MADKMMRMAGRDNEGLAKAIRTDSFGNVEVKIAGENYTVTNMNKNSDFVQNTLNWIGTNASLTAGVGTALMTATSQNGYIHNQFLERTAGHKYFIAASIKSNSPLVGLHSSGVVISGTFHSGGGSFERLSGIFNATTTTPQWINGVIDTRASGWDVVEIDNFITIDLTASFGAGKEPTKSEMEGMLSVFSNSWFSGTKTVAKETKLSNASQMDLLINKVEKQYSNILETTHHSGTNSNSNGTEVNVTGYSTALFRVEGVFKANLHFECLYDDNTTWRKLNVIDVSTGQSLQKLTSNMTETGMFRADINGFKKIRVRVARYHSGSVSIQSRCTVLPTSDTARVQVTGNAVPTDSLKVFDITTRKAYPVSYAKPYLQKKDFGVRGYDKHADVLYGCVPSNPKQLLSSSDNLETIVTGKLFNETIQAVVISDTNILVSTWNETTNDIGHVYRTAKENGVIGPFTEVEGLNLREHIYVDRFGFSSYYDYFDSNGKALRNYVCLTQYGAKTATNQAKECYFSKDGGTTFSKVFEGITGAESHIHTMVYDKYMDRLWVSNGDYGARTISFSDDHGETWETAMVDFWPTIIIPTPKYVIFGSDSTPMGLHRWNRAREEYERTIEGGKISRAFEPNWYPLRGHVAGDANFAMNYAQEDDWTFYIPFIAIGNNRKTFLLGSADGFETAHILWHDRVSTPTTGFGVGIFGTLPDGSMITHYIDSKRPANEPVFRIPKIEWKEY